MYAPTSLVHSLTTVAKPARMSVAVGEETGEDPKEETNEEVPTQPKDLPISTPKIVPVSLHDASLQALLSGPPVISPVLSHSSKTVASSSSSCQ